MEPEDWRHQSKAMATARERVTRFYQKYNADKLHEVEGVLERFRGKEAQLFSALTKKYGPEPGADEEFAPVAASAKAGKPAKEAAKAKEPEAPESQVVRDFNHARLLAFYKRYNPDKLDDVDGVLSKYKGKEAQLFNALVKKYGPEPGDSDDEDDDEEEEVPPFKEGRLERLKHIEITFVEGLPREFYMALARFLFSVVDVKTRHSRFNFYKDAFTGADAVREMVLNGFCDDQQTALRYGNVLVRLGLVEHVSRTEDQLHNSKDNFYRFTKLVEAQVGVGDASDEFARDTVARSRRASSVAAYRESVMASRESAAVGNLVEYDFTEATDEVHALVTDEALLILSKVLLKVFERKNKLLFYKGFVGCFLGAEAVNVLRELRIATSLIDAVLIGQAMLDEALIEPIASSAAGSFQDKYVFYRLTKAAAAHGAVPPMTPPTSLSVGARPPSSGSRPPSVSSQSSAP